MNEAEFEEYKEYILNLLEKARKAMEKNPLLLRRAKQIGEIINQIKQGRLAPKVLILEPGHEVWWRSLSNYPKTIIHEDKVSHLGGYGGYSWESTRIHEGDGFHVVGRIGNEVVYIAVKSSGKASPRYLGASDIAISRVHGILAPHPEEKGKFIWVHLGKNPPRIEKRKIPKR